LLLQGGFESEDGVPAEHGGSGEQGREIFVFDGAQKCSWPRTLPGTLVHIMHVVLCSVWRCNNRC